jgi:Putative Ig domain
MSRFRVGLAVIAMVMSAAVVPVVSSVGGGVADAAPCALPPPVGGVITLTASCTTTIPLSIPNGDTLNGKGFTITASDVAPGSFDGSVLNSATGGTMNVENLTIKSQFLSGPCRAVLNGILFNNASGSVNTVTVTGMTDPNKACAADGAGQGIVDTATSAQTLKITGTTVSAYMKNGVRADGPVTMDVSGSTMGPPASLVGLVAQNGLEYLLGASGTTSGSKIYGSGDQIAATDGTAVLLFGATNVTLTGNTTAGNGTDIGVAVANDSTGIVISYNQIGRTSPDNPDNTGIGISVDPSSATLICNTFSGWKPNMNVVGAIQINCTTPPHGTVGSDYSTTLTGEGGTKPYTWSVISGTVPPGLTLLSNGTISGMPTKAGTYTFVVKIVDSTGLTTTQAMTITIDPAPTTTPTTPAAPVAPITITALPVTG